MSRRRNPVPSNRVGTHQRPAARECACGHPTRDGAYVCDECLDGLAVDLRDLLPSGTEEPGLWADLQSVIAGERGIDYRTLGVTSGSSVLDEDEPDRKPAIETGIVLNEVATRRARRVRKVLRVLVVACSANRVDHTAPAEWTPRASTEVPAMAEWLSWRIGGMAWHPEFATAPQDVQRAVEAVRWSVMPQPHRQLLGDCLVHGCRGSMRAARDDTFAVCDICEAAVEARPLRDNLITELEDRLCTAAEIADLFDPDPSIRPAVRKRINKWAQRDRLLGWPRACDWTPGVCGLGPAQRGRNAPTSDTPSTFRFGDAFDLLLDHERRTRQNQETAG